MGFRGKISLGGTVMEQKNVQSKLIFAGICERFIDFK